jgi:hypothetical protein
MGIHWLGYDNGMVRKGTFVVTVQANYFSYVETDTAKYRVFCVPTIKTYSVTAYC